MIHLSVKRIALIVLQYVIDSKKKNVIGRRIYRKVMIRHNKT